MYILKFVISFNFRCILKKKSVERGWNLMGLIARGQKKKQNKLDEKYSRKTLAKMDANKDQIYLHCANLVTRWQIVCVYKMNCPRGMHNFLGTLWAKKRCYNLFSTLLEDVVTHFGITKKPFDKDKISIVSCKNDGGKGYGKFCLLYGSLCVENRLPVYLGKYKD